MSDHLPGDDALLDFIAEAAEARDGSVTRREVADAFSVKGPNRAALRDQLKSLAEKGRITLEGPRVRPRRGLPPVGVLDITDTDADGDLLCVPVTGEEVEEPSIVLDARTAAKEKPPFGVGDRLLGRLIPIGDEPGRYRVKPIKRIGKGPSARLLGVYRAHRRGGVVEPVSRKAQSLDIPADEAHGATEGDLVWAERMNARGYGPRRGRIAEVIGDGGERRNWSLIALAENDIPIEFPAEVIAEAEAQEMPSAGPYEDLRDVPLITIDPKEAKDHDDAVYAEETGDGFRVIVAIADVSAFVRPGTPLDREAEKRGNSVYLIDRVVPMLPEALSNDLCSLKANQVRPSLACEIMLDGTGRKKTHRFFRAMIKSAAGLSYEEAQAAIDGQTNKRTGPLLDTVLSPLWAAWRAHADTRRQKPSLDLDMPERQIVLGKDGRVDRVRVKERLDAHRLIETFMVLANVCAAETLEKKRQSLIYRVHGEPDPERIEGLRVFLQSMDYSLPKGQALTPSSFNRILGRAREREEIDLVAMAILRTQMQAVYETSNIGHFGLNLARYAHFTSPIRRYADLIVHRALVTALRLGPGGIKGADEERLDGVAEHISMTERRAVSAERSTQDRYLASFLDGKIGATFWGRINGVTRAGLFVTLSETGADGFIPMRSLHDDYYVHDEELQSLIGRHTGGRYRLGQQVEVKLLEATPVQGGLRFELLSDPLPPEDGNARGKKPPAPKDRPADKGRPTRHDRAKAKATRSRKGKGKGGKPNRTDTRPTDDGRTKDAGSTKTAESRPAKKAAPKEDAPKALKRRPRKTDAAGKATRRKKTKS